MNRNRVLNYIGLALLVVTTALGFQSLWGVLFLYWTIPNFYSGHAFLLSNVARNEDPALFWLIQALWVVLGLIMIFADFLPSWT